MRISSSCQKIQFHHLGANKWASSLGILVMFQVLQRYATEAWQNFSRTKQEPWQRRMFVLLTQRKPPPPNRERGRKVSAPYRGCWNLIKHPSKQPQGGTKEINYVLASRYTAGRALTLKGNLFILYHYREWPLTCCGSPVTKVLRCPEVSERTACQVATNDGVHQWWTEAVFFYPGRHISGAAEPQTEQRRTQQPLHRGCESKTVFRDKVFPGLTPTWLLHIRVEEKEAIAGVFLLQAVMSGSRSDTFLEFGWLMRLCLALLHFNNRFVNSAVKDTWGFCSLYFWRSADEGSSTVIQIIQTPDGALTEGQLHC